jgi:hypothetical protein
MKPLAFPAILLMLVTNICFAAWAAHWVIHPDSGSEDFRIIVKPVHQTKEVTITIFQKDDSKKLFERDSKGFFLITTAERMPADSLNFRRLMFSWGRYLEAKEENRSKKIIETLHERLHPLEHAKHLEPQEVEGEPVISFTLSSDVALRSYVVYDFYPWGGSLVRDGGLWITFDIPSFVESAKNKK